MKYIDAEKLKKLIDEKWKELADKNVKAGGGKWDAEISTYLSVLALIDSLQQETLNPNENQIPDENKPICIPSAWREEDIKKSPSMLSWASIDDDGKYEHGEKYYDADGNEITKEEYEDLLRRALVRRPTD